MVTFTGISSPIVLSKKRPLTPI